MSKIDELISVPIKVKFMGDEYSIEKGFTLEETPAIQMAFGSKDIKIRAEGLKNLLKVIAKRLFPGESDDKISKIDAKYAPQLLEVFYQLDSSNEKEVKDIKKILKGDKK